MSAAGAQGRPGLTINRHPRTGSTPRQLLSGMMPFGAVFDAATRFSKYSRRAIPALDLRQKTQERRVQPFSMPGGGDLVR